MGNKVTKCFLLFLILMFVSGCASDGWYAQQSREKFIRLSPEERDKERKIRSERYNKLGIVCDPAKEPIVCGIAPEPTQEEQERLKNKDSWKYKIRSWYYGIWE